MRTARPIRPGTTATDDRRKVAQLHGVGVQRVGERWFAWGEDKTAGAAFTAIACYSTGDFAEWQYEGDALTAGAGDLGADRIIERPKALQRPDGKWVLLFHLDSADYTDARVGYAVADDPQGPYQYVHAERPLENESRDIGVYQEDGVGYLLSEDRSAGLRIYRLRPDYLGADSVVVTLQQQVKPEIGYESPALVKHDGRYYLFGSDLTGWNLNDNKYTTATQLEGPWTPWRDFAPPGSRTFDSQISTVVPVSSEDFVYLGDRWTPDDLYHSSLVALPMRLHGGEAELVWREEWTLSELR